MIKLQRSIMMTTSLSLTIVEASHAFGSARFKQIMARIGYENLVTQDPKQLLNIDFLSKFLLIIKLCLFTYLIDLYHGTDDI